jgi:monovalent cation/hydrogen antiporter
MAVESVGTILVLLFAVVVSSVAGKVLPWAVPRPLVQIAVGAAIGLVAELRVPLDPHVFFLLFLPPLLFLDGWRIPREEAMRDRGPILELALGLVAFTVLGLGLLIHWMIPSIPQAVAFALAAVLAPTDPLAVAAVARRVPIPSRMMHILEGEALLNDASALVCFRFAVAAALTGSFVAADAALEFVWVASVGVAVGVGLAFLVSRLRGFLGRNFADDSGTLILISLLMPYGAYLIAELAGASGILAAASAGLTMNFADTVALPLAATRLRGGLVWDMIAFTANGVIFVLLGEQLPVILRRADAIVGLSGHADHWWLGVYVIAVVAGLLALRFAWVWVSLHISLFRTKALIPRGAKLRIVAATSVAGVRGAVTLAAILGLPLTLPDGSDFPARDLSIFLAVGTILVSVVGATVALPWLLKGLEMPGEDPDEAEEEAAQIAAAEAAIAAIARVEATAARSNADAGHIVEVAARVMAPYRRRVDRRAEDGEGRALARWVERLEREMRLAALRAERDEIMRRVRARELRSATARRLINALDLLETRHSGELQDGG